MSTPYTDWVAKIRAAGGVPTVLPTDAIAVDPFSNDTVYHSFLNAQSVPAAQYTTARATALGLFDLGLVDLTSSDGRYAYVVAPDVVVAWVAQHGISDSVELSKPAIDKATENALPDWFKSLRTGAKWAVGLAIAGGGLYVLSYLPRGNPRPRSRRQPGRRR